MKLKPLPLAITVFAKIAIAITWASPASATLVYAIGNSLTYDTIPFVLEGSVGYHIGCSKNLQQIYEDPKNSACVPPNMGTWDKALAENQFDFVTVQPYLGTTLEQDLAIINRWMKAQPKATFVIHNGWSSQTNFENNTHSPNGEKVKSQAYYSDLMNNLAKNNPDRNIVSTQSHNVLDSIYHDIENGNAPFASFSELFRDEIHMNVVTGRYLMHNLMRQALGQPIANPMELESGEIKTYLDSKIIKYRTKQSNSKKFFPALSLLLALLTVGGIMTVLWNRRPNNTNVL